jgi:NCS1 family nucleobase:cation symporter-1
MPASGLIAGGMNWWQAVGTILIGNLIVLGPMILNAHAGTKYGIPFPVLVRSSFGVRGANLPAVLRALVASGGFNPRAIVALVTGVAVALIGLVVPMLHWLYDYAWFVGFFASGSTYALLIGLVPGMVRLVYFCILLCVSIHRTRWIQLCGDRGLSIG